MTVTPPTSEGAITLASQTIGRMSNSIMERIVFSTAAMNIGNTGEVVSPVRASLSRGVYIPRVPAEPDVVVISLTGR